MSDDFCTLANLANLDPRVTPGEMFTGRKAVFFPDILSLYHPLCPFRYKAFNNPFFFPATLFPRTTCYQRSIKLVFGWSRSKQQYFVRDYFY